MHGAGHLQHDLSVVSLFCSMSADPKAATQPIKSTAAVPAGSRGQQSQVADSKAITTRSQAPRSSPSVKPSKVRAWFCLTCEEPGYKQTALLPCLHLISTWPLMDIHCCKACLRGDMGDAIIISEWQTGLPSAWALPCACPWDSGGAIVPGQVEHSSRSHGKAHQTTTVGDKNVSGWQD
jgi:hypothetical protein